jgi:hypothetical protein
MRCLMLGHRSTRRLAVCNVMEVHSAFPNFMWAYLVGYPLMTLWHQYMGLRQHEADVQALNRCSTAPARSMRGARRSCVRPRGLRAPATSLITAVLAIASNACVAASEEIQVYMDELTQPGHFGTDVHNNFVVSGGNTPDHPGALPPRHVYRLTPEFYYGMSESVELGLYLLTTTAPQGRVYYEGEKLRVKYIAPHDEKQGLFWGANFEVGKTGVRVSETPWNAELKGIYGYRIGRWTLAINANVDGSLSPSSTTPVSLEVDTKVAYETDARYKIGVESYNELGPLRDIGHLNALNQNLYLVVDTELGRFDINAGIGRGLTPVSDRWVLKFIVGLHF